MLIIAILCKGDVTSKESDIPLIMMLYGSSVNPYPIHPCNNFILEHDGKCEKQALII